MVRHLTSVSDDLRPLVQAERRAFAAKVRLARAVLGWSQTQLGVNIGLTQRAIHKLKKGETEPRRTTVEALKRVWREQKIEFNDQSDGSFQLNVNARVLWAGASVKSRHK